MTEILPILDFLSLNTFFVFFFKVQSVLNFYVLIFAYSNFRSLWTAKLLYGVYGEPHQFTDFKVTFARIDYVCNNF